MILFPAVDIRGGRCVRLTEGRFDQETVYADDPAAAALNWEQAGAEYVHVVDLEGARAGKAVQRDLVTRLVKSFGSGVQVGGGVRSSACACRREVRASRGTHARRHAIMRVPHGRSRASMT